MKRVLLAFTAIGIWVALQLDPVMKPMMRWVDRFTAWLLG